MARVTLSINTKFLYDLRSSHDIGIYWGPRETPTQNQAAFNNNDANVLCFFDAPFQGVHPQYGVQSLATTCQWLYHVSNFIFGVQGTLRIDDGTPDGAIVFNNTQLTAGDYLFLPNDQTQRTVYLMRWFSTVRTRTPRLNQPSIARRTIFTAHVQLRDGQCCKISGLNRHAGYENTCSHLIPKRLGPSAVDNIIHRYTGAVTNWGHDRPEWDCRVGVMLHGALDHFLDSFTMGFYNPNPGTMQYEVHDLNFAIRANEQDPTAGLKGWTRLALRWDTIVHSQLPFGANDVVRLNLHHSTVNFPAQGAPVMPDPPFEVLGWHYVQCVMRKWSTAAYMNYPNIRW
ncbi:hypothetical protein BDW02DRAFT_629268 [Decorospora gaudefroyi]|uniref:Uncharacterized protein n=1 Tax=Decorospora gaudefroyi TaxID=184978 RepID=A0A6A5KK79_9PLEO|nr:hypothetical protein BDW02DRAFT_629268 [Decorospora gaudefroyi]